MTKGAKISEVLKLNQIPGEVSMVFDQSSIAEVERPDIEEEEFSILLDESEDQGLLQGSRKNLIEETKSIEKVNFSS